MMHRLMSGLGISEHIELLCFHVKEKEKSKTSKIGKYMKTVQSVPKKRKEITSQLNSSITNQRKF